MSLIGLKIDVDTLRGTRLGVPNLLTMLAAFDIQASFFFTVGPDNMGRHLWRLLRPKFLAKMWRTRAPKLYGWDILAMGTFRPGPCIGTTCPEPIRAAAHAGHEVGLHAWDHHQWQTRLPHMSHAQVTETIARGVAQLSDILGAAPTAFAAPGWQMTPTALHALATFPFAYQSDCRGVAPFEPVVAGTRLKRVQIPTTLPTFDEVVGPAFPAAAYYADLIRHIKPDCFNILTIHAEVEGIAHADDFRNFLAAAVAKGMTFTTLAAVKEALVTAPAAAISLEPCAGREGRLAVQVPLQPTDDIG